MANIVDQIARQVLLTLAYSAQYGFSLTREEIQRRLFRVVLKDGGREKQEWFPTQLVDLAIDQLLWEGYIDFDGTYYCFFSRHPEPTTQRRRGRRPQLTKFPSYLDRHQLSKSSEKKRQALQPLIDYLSTLPWVEGVAITGSLAMYAADEQADADFLIVTQPNRLWLTRLKILRFASKHGKRRTFAHEEPNSWCFNLWLDTNHLFVPRSQHSLYTAYEVCQADWVINRHQTAQKFLLANTWVRRTLPEYYTYRQKNNEKVKSIVRGGLTTWRILSPVFGLLELVAYASQRLYMKPHQTTERVARGFAWFHPGKNT